MIKKLLLLLFVMASPLLLAQNVTRVLVQGQIHVPPKEDAEGISVYNTSSQKGTVTDKDGFFQIAVAENDRLMVFALQYKSFTVVVDKGIVDVKKMNIYLNPSVTPLDEVVVRPSDLTGNIRVDIEKIPTYYRSLDLNLSYADMEFGQGFVIDEQTAIRGNAAEEALNLNQLQHGLNFVSIFGGVGSLLFPKGKKTVLKTKVDDASKESNNLQRELSRKLIEDNFGIPEDQAFEFLFYAQDKGLNSSMLKPENEMLLMDFLQKRSVEFKKLKK